MSYGAVSCCSVLDRVEHILYYTVLEYSTVLRWLDFCATSTYGQSTKSESGFQRVWLRQTLNSGVEFLGP